MMTTNKDTILSKIIAVSEKLEGGKLEENTLESCRAEIDCLTKYLGTDENQAILFALVFALQNQKQQAVSLCDIAEFLDYSLLRILVFRKDIDSLESMGLVYVDGSEGRAKRSERGGYKITQTVLNNVICDEPVVIFKEEEAASTEAILSDIFELIFDYSKDNLTPLEYKRQIMDIEARRRENEAIKNLTSLFPDDFDSRAILYYICHTLLHGDELLHCRSRGPTVESAIFEALPFKSRFSRKASMRNEKDILFTKGLITKKYVDSGEWYRGSEQKLKQYVFTQEGIKAVFGNEAEKYLSSNSCMSEIDMTMTVLTEFGEVYEDHEMKQFEKRDRLGEIETKSAHLPLFEKAKKVIANQNHRFFLYDCAKDFSLGEESGLTRTLNDLYPHDATYFKELRSMLDEEHPLVKDGFIEIEKDEVVEKSTATITDKTIELIYGENADLYKKKVVDKNIIDPEKIKEKKLFYSEQVERQIDTLTQSLASNNLEAMQERLGAKGLPGGVAAILYGAPGTGKTESVYQIAKKTNRKILHVDIADSKSMWFGESEKKIKKIFTNYRSLCKNCKSHNENVPILLFNEADALISKRKDVTSGNCAQTENAIQNILLEELEKLDGVMIATTNLCDNMDKAFERRFLFKVKFEKPSLEARTKIWQNKMPDLPEEQAKELADRFDFSGGEIDTIVRKCEMNEVIRGKRPSRDELFELCKEERLLSDDSRRIGFGC